MTQDLREDHDARLQPLRLVVEPDLRPAVRVLGVVRLRESTGCAERDQSWVDVGKPGV